MLGDDLEAWLAESALRKRTFRNCAIIAGLIPTALGLGIGGGGRAAIAVTIIGGQSLCLFLTLLLVPVAYAKVARLEDVMAQRSIRTWIVGGRLALGDRR